MLKKIINIIISSLAFALLAGCVACSVSPHEPTTGVKNYTKENIQKSNVDDGNDGSNISYVEENSTLPSITALHSKTLGESESEGSERAVEDDLIISRYHGGIETEDGLILYDITTKQLVEYQYIMDLQFYDYGSKKLIQQLIYTLRNDFMSDTVRKGFQVVDINNDGNDDIIIDLGIYGKFRFAVCYVYDPDQKGYYQLIGFDDLMSPEYVIDQGIIFEEWRGDATEYGLNKYFVNGNEMVLVASLYLKYGTPTSPICTEKILINGEMVIVKENVPLEEIDSNEWNNSIP